MTDTAGPRGVDPTADPDDSASALREFERRLVELKKVPDVERLATRRFAFVLQVLVAVALGGVAGTGSIFLNYLVFTKLLHI